MLLQLLFVYAPFMHLWFHTAPLALRDWLLPLGSGIGVFLLVEIEKALARAFTPKASAQATV
jgi:hypothetical protein